MQEIKKRRIVIASILKPVNDTRMFEKIGVSLATTGKYEVHIIGYPSKEKISSANIQFHPLKSFKRISLGRIAARLKVLKMTIQVKPELLIVTTTELLSVGLVNRILFGSRICYDIQENYWENIVHGSAFPKAFRLPIASMARLKEWIVSPFISRFFLAEKCYVDELPFIQKKYVVIENKCKVPDSFQRKPGTDFIQLIFTGTLAETTGIFHVIDLAKQLHSVEPKIRLTIIGYSALQKTLHKIKEEISKNPFISLIGGDEIVPHPKIMEAIATANFGVVHYPLSPQVENKIPTKLYEYLSCELPMLLQDHKPWVEVCKPFNAAITINFEQLNIDSILSQIRSGHFYTSKPVDVRWESEEQKLLGVIADL